MRTRYLILTAAFGAAGLGTYAGAINLASGLIDQAIAFSWPGFAAAIVLALAAPSRAK